MGLVYILGRRVSPCRSFIRDAIDFVSGPTTFFIAATLGFVAMLAYRRILANGLVAWGIVNLFLLFFGLSMTDFDFRDIVTKPDNVPIVGLIVLVGFFTWLAPPPGRHQRRADGRRACRTSRSSSTRRC